MDRLEPKVSWDRQVKLVHLEGTDCQECLVFQDRRDRKEKGENRESDCQVVQAVQERMESQDYQDWLENQDRLDPLEPQANVGLREIQEIQDPEDSLGRPDLPVPRVRLEMDDQDFRAQKDRGVCLVWTASLERRVFAESRVCRDETCLENVVNLARRD